MIIRTIWRVGLRKPREIQDGSDGLLNWIRTLPGEMNTVKEGNRVLEAFAKEYGLQHYKDDECIKIDEEERIMLLLRLDPALTLRKML